MRVTADRHARVNGLRERCLGAPLTQQQEPPCFRTDTAGLCQIETSSARSPLIEAMKARIRHSISSSVSSYSCRRSRLIITLPGTTLREHSQMLSCPVVARPPVSLAILSASIRMRAASVRASRRMFIGIVPACASRPVIVRSYQRIACTPVMTPMSIFSRSRTGPCSMCSSNIAPNFGSPIGMEPRQLEPSGGHRNEWPMATPNGRRLDFQECLRGDRSKACPSTRRAARLPSQTRPDRLQ